MQKIYFSTTPLIITSSQQPISKGEVIKNGNKKTIQTALKQFDKGDQQLVLIEADEEQALENIKRDFTVIQAAGGLAYTPSQDVLLIFRRGKWDLPKGKLDEGESLETCAIREIEEETGLKNAILVGLIQKTYHTYQENGEDILKETFWYYMKAEKQELHPQTDEDIEECRWVPKETISSYFSNMQPSVTDVLKTFLANK
jgi:8-oxo-dGTP pyrophosphatase MutT (NUDIX family)